MRLENPNKELRPGMYAAVTIDTPLETIEPYKSLAAKTARGCRELPTDQRSVPSAPRGERGESATEFLVVPEQAVVDTGTKKVVMSSARTGCSRASKSNWDRGRMISTRCSRG